ncbi:hypothetical protein BA895_08245 [Humibacillus sp. DSM 29435]|nr:hypothetical protein BA895_08245 [Humibacillus sp. DSM 29435]
MPVTAFARPSKATPQAAQQAAGSRFAGDPGSGKLYYGASVVASYGLSTLESQLKHKVGVHRGYFVPKSQKGLLQQVKDDHANGRLPSVSTKVPDTWGNMAAGKQDAWLRVLLTALAQAKKPVFLTLHHEPENDTGGNGMKPQDWRSMYDHAVVLAASVAPNVTMVPILMQFTFDPGSGRKPADWVPTTTKVFSTDCYNAWSQSNGLKWRSLGDKMSMTLPYANGRPIVLGEYGCRTDPKNPGLAAAWMRDAFDWCRTHNVVSMSYFNSYQHSRFGSWELDTERLNAMRTLITSPYSVSL